jgi:nucleoside-diphosphate-sugar epimerase
MQAAAITVGAFDRMFRRSTPRTLTPDAVRLLGLRRRADTTRARERLGFRPTPLHDAFREAWAFHRGRGSVGAPPLRLAIPARV